MKALKALAKGLLLIIFAWPCIIFAWPCFILAWVMWIGGDGRVLRWMFKPYPDDEP